MDAGIGAFELVGVGGVLHEPVNDDSVIAFSCDTSRMSGPPFNVDAAVVHECFPPPATPRTLTSRELISSEPRFRDRGLTSIREECWVITSD